MSALPLRADIVYQIGHVRKVPITGTSLFLGYGQDDLRRALSICSAQTGL